MKDIVLKNVFKSYDEQQILEDISLTIPGGKFFALLGPSGCGKTTILRLIGGFEKVDAGSIYLGEQNITDVPIYERKINTVFQQYALFPHFTVFENVAYGLRVKGVPEEELEERVHKSLRMIQMSRHHHKFPKSLSGGQQQRVALARAIVNEPEVLLLDEPLAALDLKLKEKMLIELIDIQDKLKTTFVYVTHDQEEALTLSDQMAIMNDDGIIEQIDKPKVVYELPRTRFVAHFVGNTNIFSGTIKIDADKILFEAKGLETFLVKTEEKDSWIADGVEAFLSIRPEKIFMSKKKQDAFSNVLLGKILDIIYYGASTEYRVVLANGQKTFVFEQNEEHFVQEEFDYDDDVYLYFQKNNVVLLPS